MQKIVLLDGNIYNSKVYQLILVSRTGQKFVLLGKNLYHSKMHQLNLVCTTRQKTVLLGGNIAIIRCTNLIWLAILDRKLYYWAETFTILRRTKKLALQGRKLYY